MHSIRFLIISLAGLLLIAGCGKKKELQILDLQQKNDLLEAEFQQKDSLVNELFISMNAIEKNLSDITAREKKILATPVQEMRGDEDIRDKIMQEIILINNILEENKKRISLLNDQLKKSNLNVASLQENIKMLTHRLEESEEEISKLKEQLMKLNFDIKLLNATVDTLREEAVQKYKIISQQDALLGEMNTVWFVSGTRKELIERGIIEKAGGLFSSRMKMTDKLNPDHYTTADLRELSIISFECEKAEIVTVHPEGSYHFIKEGDILKGIEILNPKEFWKSSRFLVIMIK